MTFSKEWNGAYSNGQVGMQLPSMEVYLARLFIRYLPDGVVDKKVLELGCAGGHNATQLQNGGAKYFGIDGRQESIDRATNEFPNAVFRCADFTKTIPFDDKFDVIFDRASIAHNDLQSVLGTIRLIWDKLVPGGTFIGCDWFSVRHSEFAYGEVVESGTKTGYRFGQFAGVGNVHFFDEMELFELFKDFEFIRLQERTEHRILSAVKLRWESERFDRKTYQSAWWDIIVRKPK